jgi:hypothetical protein
LHNYEKLIAPWVEAFGDEAIVLCPYEKAKSDGGIVKHLLNLLGVHDHGGLDFSIETKHQNLRLHALATEFLRRVNRYPFLNDEYLAIVEDLQRISPEISANFAGSFRVFSPQIVDELRNQFSESNRKLFAAYSSYGEEALFLEKEKKSALFFAGKNFDADVQCLIFNALNTKIQALLETIPKVKSRKVGEPFLPPPPKGQEERLNEIIFRQRFELRRLYEKLGCKG